MCPRGQFIQMYPRDAADNWAVCDGQDDRKCAERCYCRYFGGGDSDRELDAAYWTRWVGRRMAHVREDCGAVDVFIAPARYLLRLFRDEFGLPGEKLVYLDYGFHLDRLEGRKRTEGEPFTFGYIGTHIPAKGWTTWSRPSAAWRASPGCGSGAGTGEWRPPGCRPWPGVFPDPPGSVWNGWGNTATRTSCPRS